MLKLEATLQDSRVTTLLNGEATASQLVALTCGTVEAVLEVVFERSAKDFDYALDELSKFVRALKGE